MQIRICSVTNCMNILCGQRTGRTADRYCQLLTLIARPALPDRCHTLATHSAFFIQRKLVQWNRARATSSPSCSSNSSAVTRSTRWPGR